MLVSDENVFIYILSVFQADSDTVIGGIRDDEPFVDDRYATWPCVCDYMWLCI